MKFLVCRKDGVEGSMKSSELWPTIVEAEIDASASEIVQIALDSKWPGYQPRNKSYYVIPMSNALLVTFKPRQEYDVIVESV